ncbi:MAG TPA: EamA family transporter [Streptosporangiaceae bacterium]|nr:EamA family transporter [Streptosporangiaceae bacterium]
MPDAEPPAVARAAPPQSAGGAVAILAGAAAWGSTGTAAHFAPPGASSASIGAARIVLGGALLLCVCLRSAAGRRTAGRLLAGSGRSRAVLLLAAAAVGGYQLCFFTAVRMTGVAIGTVVAIGSAPVFTGVLSRITGGPRLDRTWMLATAAAVAGCAVLVTGGRSAGANPGGVALALAAGLCYACYAVAAARLIAAGTPESAVMGLLFGAAAVLLAPVLAATSPGWVLTGRGIAVTAYLGIVTTVVAYLLYGRGLRTVPAPVAVTLGLAEPVVAAILGLVVLGERLTPTAAVGLVLVGLALAALAAGRRKSSLTPGPPVGPPG